MIFMAETIEIAPKPQSGEPWDVAIIGSGPAGLTAAIYATRGAASTVILGGEKWGGQLMLTTEVDNFPAHKGIQGPELMQKLRDHATSFGAEFVEKNVETVDFSGNPFKLTASGNNYLAKTVIISTGAETKWLGIPGEDKLRGRGVSSCAPCDAPFSSFCSPINSIVPVSQIIFIFPCFCKLKIFFCIAADALKASLL